MRYPLGLVELVEDTLSDLTKEGKGKGAFDETIVGDSMLNQPDNNNDDVDDSNLTFGQRKMEKGKKRRDTFSHFIKPPPFRPI